MATPITDMKTNPIRNEDGTIDCSQCEAKDICRELAAIVRREAKGGEDLTQGTHQQCRITDGYLQASQMVQKRREDKVIDPLAWVLTTSQINSMETHSLIARMAGVQTYIGTMIAGAVAALQRRLSVLEGADEDLLDQLEQFGQSISALTTGMRLDLKENGNLDERAIRAVDASLRLGAFDVRSEMFGAEVAGKRMMLGLFPRTGRREIYEGVMGKDDDEPGESEDSHGMKPPEEIIAKINEMVERATRAAHDAQAETKKDG